MAGTFQDALGGIPFSYILVIKGWLRWSGFEPKIFIREYRSRTMRNAFHFPLDCEGEKLAYVHSCLQVETRLQAFTKLLPGVVTKIIQCVT